MDIRKAIRFVKENGTELEKYRLNYLLGKERDDEFPLRYLRGFKTLMGAFLTETKKAN